MLWLLAATIVSSLASFIQARQLWQIKNKTSHPLSKRSFFIEIIIFVVFVDFVFACELSSRNCLIDLQQVYKTQSQSSEEVNAMRHII